MFYNTISLLYSSVPVHSYSAKLIYSNTNYSNNWMIYNKQDLEFFNFVIQIEKFLKIRHFRHLSWMQFCAAEIKVEWLICPMVPPVRTWVPSYEEGIIQKRIWLLGLPDRSGDRSGDQWCICNWEEKFQPGDFCVIPTIFTNSNCY